MQKIMVCRRKQCTFIILDAEKYNGLNDEIASMAGDMNLFFNDEYNLKRAETENHDSRASLRRSGHGQGSTFSHDVLWNDAARLD